MLGRIWTFVNVRLISFFLYGRTAVARGPSKARECLPHSTATADVGEPEHQLFPEGLDQDAS